MESYLFSSKSTRTILIIKNVTGYKLVKITRALLDNHIYMDLKSIVILGLIKKDRLEKLDFTHSALKGEWEAEETGKK